MTNWQKAYILYVTLLFMWDTWAFWKDNRLFWMVVSLVSCLWGIIILDGAYNGTVHIH